MHVIKMETTTYKTKVGIHTGVKLMNGAVPLYTLCTIYCLKYKSGICHIVSKTNKNEPVPTWYEND